MGNDALNDKNNGRKEKIEALAGEILRLSRNTLIIKARFLDWAISKLECVSTTGLYKETGLFCGSYATDGKHIFFTPSHVLESYKENKESIVRAYLHIIMHCVFRHFFVTTLVDQKLWNISCDIAVENMINELGISSDSISGCRDQKSVIEELKEELKLLSAEKIYRYYMDKGIGEREKEELEEAFSVDDHTVWYDRKQMNKLQKMKTEEKDESGEQEKGEPSNSGKGKQDEDGRNRQESEAQAINKEWEQVARQMQINMESFSRAIGKNAGSLTQNLNAINREKHDYAEFLKKFAVMGEVMKLNDDEFDYIFYTYGLQLYENMPLVEPLEYKEVKRVREFVIAIDTSGSVSGMVVQKFLQKTYNILKQSENYFSKVNIHILQCDAKLQEDHKITSQEEFDRYIGQMKIRGLGGTDFRPVFEYVDKMIKNHEFQNLKGLIYFTDGFGVYPEKQPDYNTAFVFLDDDYHNPKVPVWAIKLLLQTEEV